jgi:hypothetical protein
MNEHVFAVKDIIANVYLPLFQARTPGAAERSFAQAINSNDHQFAANPQDFVLYCLGNYDLDSGKLQPVDPYVVVTGEQVSHGKAKNNGASDNYASESI